MVKDWELTKMIGSLNSAKGQTIPKNDIKKI